MRRDRQRKGRRDDDSYASSIVAGSSLYLVVRRKLHILDPKTGATLATLF